MTEVPLQQKLAEQILITDDIKNAVFNLMLSGMIKGPELLSAFKDYLELNREAAIKVGDQIVTPDHFREIIDQKNETDNVVLTAALQLEKILDQLEKAKAHQPVFLSEELGSTQRLKVRRKPDAREVGLKNQLEKKSFKAAFIGAIHHLLVVAYKMGHSREIIRLHIIAAFVDKYGILYAEDVEEARAFALEECDFLLTNGRFKE